MWQALGRCKRDEAFRWNDPNKDEADEKSGAVQSAYRRQVQETQCRVGLRSEMSRPDGAECNHKGLIAARVNVNFLESMYAGEMEPKRTKACVLWRKKGGE